MQIVSFAGLAKAGKSTAVAEVAKWCIENGYTPKLLSFAGPLKAAAEAIGASKGGPNDRLYRKFCQDIGTSLRDPEYMPGITGPSYWADVMKSRIQQVSLEEQAALASDMNFHERVILIDDVRFHNELELLRDLGAVQVFICAHRRLKDLDAEWRKHPSEKMATDYTNGCISERFDYSISNNQNEAGFKLTTRELAPVLVGQVAGG